MTDLEKINKIYNRFKDSSGWGWAYISYDKVGLELKLKMATILLYSTNVDYETNGLVGHLVVTYDQGETEVENLTYREDTPEGAAIFGFIEYVSNNLSERQQEIAKLNQDHWKTTLEKL